MTKSWYVFAMREPVFFLGVDLDARSRGETVSAFCALGYPDFRHFHVGA